MVPVTAASSLELSGRTIDVWPVRLEASVETTERLQRVLTPDEAERVSRFRFDHLRSSFVLSRGALRLLIGRYLHIAPQDVEFSYGSKGKPRLAASTGLDFNASHSGALALFAFTLGCEIGADVEQIHTVHEMHALVARFFSPEEAAEWTSLPADQRELAFFSCWTRKEAYLKAIGEGLSAPLQNFQVTLRPGDPPRFVHIEHDETAAEAWTLQDLALDAKYAAALAYRDAPRPIRLFPPADAAGLLKEGA